MSYAYDQKPNTALTEKATNAIESIKTSEYAILVGRNNTGKSYLLREITRAIGESASYLGPARYQNFHLLPYFTPNQNRKQEKWNQFLQFWRNKNQNLDNSPLNLQQAIAELTDEGRGKLTEITGMLLNSKMDIVYTVPDNSMSQKYISADGHNISFTSSGYRLITTIVTSLLDDSYNTFLIDEPELGISPEAQGILADFLFDRDHRKKYFPHIKTLIFGTHSTVFLDRQHITNNYEVTKTGDVIDVRRVATIADFGRIHFFLLGNRFETLYLPSIIILVEGPCEHRFISAAMATLFPSIQTSIINCNSDGRMKEIMNTAKMLLGDFQKSPYRGRIIPILDKTHGQDIVQALTGMGVPKDNMIIWDKNGIEHYYPKAVLDEIFGKSEDAIEIAGDTVSRNGLSYKKLELAEKVAKLITGDVIHCSEFREKLLNKIADVTGALLTQSAN